MKCPCRGCPDRTVTCHYEGYCDKWTEWKAFHEGRKEWLDSFKVDTSDQIRKRERLNIKARARGWRKKTRGVRNDG